MSLPCINLRCDYFRHPKTERLKALLGPEADVFVPRLWAICGEFHCQHGRFVHPENGRMAAYTVAEIEAMAKWTGDAGKLINALASVGFMGVKNGAWTMLNWRENQGHIYAMKVRGRRNAKVRWDQIRRAKVREDRSDASSNAAGNAKAMPRQCSNQPAVPANQPYPLKDRGGGGKNRSGKSSAAAKPSAKAPFPLPDFTELPRPLFGDKAKAMLADCEAIIEDIKKTGCVDQGEKDVLGQSVPTLLPEAREAIKAWRKRMGEIRQARAG